MKKRLILTITVLAVLAVAWIAFGQEQSERAQRFAQYRQVQLKAIELIQEQAAKMKVAIEESPSFDRSRFQEMSDEEREEFREQRMKRREERRIAINMIITQVAILQGQMQPAEGERYILVNTAELKAVQALAKKEKAEEVAERITGLLEPPRRGFGGRRGPGPRGGAGGEEADRP